MHNPPTHVEGWRPKPQIIEYLNMADFTHQVRAWAGRPAALPVIPHPTCILHRKSMLRQPPACGIRCAAQIECAVNVDEPIFQPFPPEVVFSDYLEFEKYDLLLCLRNNDKVRPRQPAAPGPSLPSLRGAAAARHPPVPSLLPLSWP